MKSSPSIIFFLLFLNLNILYASPGQTTARSDFIRQLAEAYQNFDDEKCSQLLTVAFNSLDSFSPQEKIEIYKYAGFIAFQKGNVTLASNHFWHILEIDPTYNLNPVETPPKILTLFQKTKIDFLEDLNRRLQALSTQTPAAEVPWRSFVLPGWEHWRRGVRTRGAIYAATSSLLAGGFIYALWKTHESKSRYLEARSPDEAESRYNTYDRYYRLQYYLAYALAATWTWTQLDLFLLTTPRISLQPISSSFSGSVGLALKIQF